MPPSAHTFTDPHTIAINRRGEITPDQREALQQSAGSFGLLGCGFSIALTALVVVTMGKWLEQHEIIGLVVIVVILIVSAFIAGRITSLPMRRRLANARAEAVRGEVVWQGKNYVPVAQGHRLKPAGTPPDLPPGQYTFYKLENSSWLLAAERLADGTPTVSTFQPPVSESNSMFQDVMPPSAPNQQNFTADEMRRALATTHLAFPTDLEANRSGHLTARQRMMILRDLLSSAVFAIGAVVISIFVFSRVATGFEQKDIGGALLAGGVFLVIGLAAIFISLPKLLDALGGSVDVVTGPAHLFNQPAVAYGRGRIHFYCEINGQQFTVPVASYNALIEGVVYRVYYTPRSKMRLNIEPGTP